MEHKNVGLKSGRVWHYVSPRNIRWMNDPEVIRYLTQRERVTYWRAFHYFLSHWIKGDILWAIYIENMHIGNCGLFEIKDDSAQLRLMIGEKQWWGRGVGHDTVQNMLDKSIKFGFKQIWLNVHLRNTSALRLYQKAGFIKDSNVVLPNGVPQIRMTKQV